MINTLNIKNFRTWKEAILNFCPGVNVIIGNPDSGKTNIVRALIWALYNRPLGNRMQSDFIDDPVSVTVRFDDTVAVLKKVKDKSVYLHDGKEYRAIDKEVPDIISSGANISDLNIQKQLDEPYLICSSPGEVAKELNRVTHLENIEEWTSNLTSMVNANNKVLRSLEADVSELERTIEKIGDLSGIEEKLLSLEEMGEKVVSLIYSIDAMEGHIEEIEKLEKRVRSLQIPEKVEEKIAWLNDTTEEMKILDSKILRTSETLRTVENTVKMTAIAKNTLLTELKEYQTFIKTLKTCPFCEFCKTDISKHSLEQLLEEFSV